MQIFSMKKWKLLTCGLICAMNAILALIALQIVIGCIFAAISVPFLGLWYYRYQRDQKIIAASRLVDKVITGATASHPQALSPQETTANRRLFIPDKLS